VFKELIAKIKRRFMTQNVDVNVQEQMKVTTKENGSLQLELNISYEKLRDKDQELKVLKNHIKRLQEQLINYQGNAMPDPVPTIRKKVNPLELLNRLFAAERFEECSEATKKFTQQVNPNEYSLEGLRKLCDYLEQVFSFVPKVPNRLVGLYSNCLAIIKLFIKKEVMKEFLAINDKKMNQCINWMVTGAFFHEK
jgi:hypothetical protein